MSPEIVSPFANYPILEGRVPHEHLTQISPHILAHSRTEEEIFCAHIFSSIVWKLTGPPAGGKDSLAQILAAHPALGFKRPKTTTTREEIRPDEVGNDPYNRMSIEEFFEARDRGEFLEFNPHESGGRINWYGTPKAQIRALIENGDNVLLRVDPNGAINMHNMWLAGDPVFKNCLVIHSYIVPPSLEQLYERLLLRAREDKRKTEKQIQFEHKKRIPQVLSDLEKMNEAHLILINSDNELEEVAVEVASLILALNNKRAA